MTTRHHLFGTTVSPTYDSDPAAIGAAVSIGGITKRPPIRVVRALEKIANGKSSAVLSSEDRLQLKDIGVNLVDSTNEVRERDANAMLAAGTPAPLINAHLAKVEQQFKAAETVTLLQYFKPV